MLVQIKTKKLFHGLVSICPKSMRLYLMAGLKRKVVKLTMSPF